MVPRPSTFTPSLSNVRWKVGTTENTPMEPVRVVGLAKIWLAAAAASLTVTRRQSPPNSSRMIMGMAVWPPWPISTAGVITVISSFSAICKKAEGGRMLRPAGATPGAGGVPGVGAAPSAGAASDASVVGSPDIERLV